MSRRAGDRGPLPPLYFFVTIVVMIGLHALVPLVTLVPGLWGLLGLIPLGLGVLLNAWAHRLFRVHETTTETFERSRALIVAGPFLYTRNPMYLGAVFILIGLALLLGSLTPFLVVPLFVWLISRRFIEHEERALAGRFGAEYQRYSGKVRRWF